MRKAQFFYLLRRGLLSGGLNFIKEGLVMASKFTTQGLSFPSTGSAEFNGTSDFIQLNDPFSHTNHTIAAWVYANDTAAGKLIFNSRDAFNDGYALTIGASENIRYRINATTISDSGNYSNEWVYAVGTYDGTTMKLYANGSLLVSSAISNTISVTTDARIGNKSWTDGDYMNGNLANVAIWNRALSSDEINSVMWKPVQALTATESNGLQAWYSLDDIASPTASLASMEQLATDKNLTIENKAAITTAINKLS